jgi:hypothetical protein
MNPRFNSLRTTSFYGFIILAFFILIVCQPIAAAEMTTTPTDNPVAFMAGSLTLFFGIVSFGVLVMAMTAFFSLLIGSVQERKNRFIILGILLFLVVFKGLLPLLLTGLNFEGLVGYVTILLNIIGMCKFPLVIILAGTLWFWPENKISWKDSVLCSAIVFVIGAVTWGILALTGSLPQLFEFINEISHSAPGNPEVPVFVLFFISLITLILTLILSWMGFRVIAKYRERQRAE